MWQASAWLGWDCGMSAHPLKPAVLESKRSIVSVAFQRGDFALVARFAAARGKKVSEFIRDASLDAVASKPVSPDLKRVIHEYMDASLEHLTTHGLNVTDEERHREAGRWLNAADDALREALDAD